MCDTESKRMDTIHIYYTFSRIILVFPGVKIKCGLEKYYIRNFRNTQSLDFFYEKLNSLIS